MDAKFYADLTQMVNETQVRMDQYEANQTDQPPANQLRAIGAACLIGDTIHPDIRAALGARHLHDFQSAVIRLFKVMAFTRGRDKNPQISADLSVIKRMSQVLEAELKENASVPLEHSSPGSYVNASRITALRELQTPKLDPQRLIQLLEELNAANAAGSHMATGMIVRAILDHVPTVFNRTNFTQVGANHGGKSFKDSMEHLDKSLRKIADRYLHSHMRLSDDVPTFQQVDFRAPLDLLLSEVVLELRANGAGQTVLGQTVPG